MSRGIRRFFAGVVTIALAVIGFQIAGTVSAFAHANVVTGSVQCVSADGTYTVTWTVTNDYHTSDRASATSYSPSGTALAPQVLDLGAQGTANDSGVMVQSKIPGTATSADLTVQGVWSDYTGSTSGSVTLGGTCQPAKTATAPSSTNGACVNRTQVQPTITIPNDSGVDYKLDGASISSGTHTVTAAHHDVVASSTTYDLSGGQTSFPFDLTAAPADCNDTVIPVAPTITESQCVNSAPSTPTLTLQTTTGIGYTTSGTVAAGQQVTVTATAKPGYEFKSAPSGWVLKGSTEETFTHTFGASAKCAATPASPTITQSQCLGAGAPSAPTLTLVPANGVSYTTKPAGPYKGGDTVTVTATALDNFQFTSAPQGWTLLPDGTETWTKTFDATPTCVAPASPAANQATCQGVGSGTTVPSLTVVPTSGVTYKFDPAQGPYAVGQTVTVTATADSGVNFFTTAPKDWTYNSPVQETYKITFDAAPNCVQPAVPMYADSSCVNSRPTGSTYTIPSTPEVDYYVATVKTAAGTYPAVPGSTIVVVAEAQPGYKLTGNTSFSHTFPAATTCTTPVVATTAKFSDDKCIATGPSGATYTVPSTNGVSYSVEGATIAGGTYPATDGTTITILATAKSGYLLTGITQWTHKFTAKPTVCSGTDSASKSPLISSNGGGVITSNGIGGATAYTGVPIGQLVLAGIALLLMGTACFVGASRRYGDASA